MVRTIPTKKRNPETERRNLIFSFSSPHRITFCILTTSAPKKMASSASTAAAVTTAASNDGTALRVGDLVVATDKIWTESQNFPHFMRRQTGSRISLPKGAVFRVADVIHSSGDFILNIANVFDEANAGSANRSSSGNHDEEDHTRQLLRRESLIFCSKGDEKKLQVLERISSPAAPNATSTDATDDKLADFDVSQRDNSSDATNDKSADFDVSQSDNSSEGGDNYGEADQSDDDDDGEEPMLLLGSAPYQDIVRLMCRGLSLPIDVAKHMTKFLQIKHVEKNHISVVRASSTRGDYPLSSVLGNEEGTWWISVEGSMESGQGKEYLEFSLSANGTARRCSYVGLSIPPLPHGPLSVRRFRIDWSYDGKEWTEGCRRYTMETMDMAGMQSFKLDQPIDAAKVRLVCLSNAFTSARGGTSPFDCVGLFYVRWK